MLIVLKNDEFVIFVTDVNVDSIEIIVSFCIPIRFKVTVGNVGKV